MDDVTVHVSPDLDLQSKIMEAGLVDRIEQARRHNNHCWMDLLRLALEAEPQRAKAILLKINRNDSEIQKLLGELASS